MSPARRPAAYEWAGARTTLLIVPDDLGAIRQVTVSMRRLRAGAAVAGGAALVLIACAVGFFVGPGADERMERLSRDNAALAAEVGDLHARYDRLRSLKAELESRERTIRRLARLDGGEAVSTAWSAGRGAGRPGVVLASGAGGADPGALVRRARGLAGRWRDTQAELEPGSGDLAATPSVAPATGYLSQPFAPRMRHPIVDGARPHWGIDIVAPEGTAVVAAARGRVRTVGRFPGIGVGIELDHGNGYVTRYAHLAGARVEPGQRLERGERLGTIGETGVASGPHLHYEVRIHDRPQDPLLYIFDDTSLADYRTGTPSTDG